MRVVFLGKNKPSAASALEYLIARGVEIAAVVAPRAEAGTPGLLRALAEQAGAPVVTDRELYAALAGEPQAKELQGRLTGIDLVVSFLFWRRIRAPLLALPSLGAINFHPAPLPEFRGVCGYSFAIWEGVLRWGVSAHFIDESFDTGDLIRVRRFAIDPGRETAHSLEAKTQPQLVELFRKVIDPVLAGAPLERTPQQGGRYYSRDDFEALRRVQPSDDAEQIERKIRACWFPPHAGACVQLDGKDYTLVDDELLRRLARPEREDES